MQSDQQYHPRGRVMNPFENQMGGPASFPFQPPENCMEDFMMFNPTVDRSRMMFNPVMPQQFAYPGYNVHAASMEHNNVERWNMNEEKEMSSPFTEDTNEINALLSLDNDQYWESEEEEVSTARTNGYDGSSSPESSCNYSSKSKKTKCSSLRSSNGEGSSSSCNNERKRKKMQKMVSVLRGIVPGGQRLGTAAVLDEAVKYLKSLKVEVEKNGVGDTTNQS